MSDALMTLMNLTEEEFMEKVYMSLQILSEVEGESELNHIIIKKDLYIVPNVFSAYYIYLKNNYVSIHEFTFYQDINVLNKLKINKYDMKLSCLFFIIYQMKFLEDHLFNNTLEYYDLYLNDWKSLTIISNEKPYVIRCFKAELTNNDAIIIEAIRRYVLYMFINLENNYIIKNVYNFDSNKQPILK
jgi:phosphomevalonate kinase